MSIYVIGVGLGNPDTLTVAAQRTIADCGVLIGAKRLLEYHTCPIRLPLITPQEILSAVKVHSGETIGILLSGDVGFYSGATKLLPLLQGEDVTVIPGLSSLQYFCAKLTTPWQDCHLLSAHGRSHNALGEIQCHPKTFLLTGSNFTPMDLIAQLVERGLGDCTVAVGEGLSYPEERLTEGTAHQLLGQSFAPLSVALVVNPAPISSTYGIHRDEDFLRGQVPMTKEEIRTLSLHKLQVAPHHTVWDVGAGTGAMTVTLAEAARAGQVFAVEQKEEAVALLQSNKEKFTLPNIVIIQGKAPHVLTALPAPDRLFIGGSGGNLEEIIALALAKNPALRLVITAVTLETLAQSTALCTKLNLHHVDMVQISATRTRVVGSYHLMEGQNPIWVISAQGGIPHE